MKRLMLVWVLILCLVPLGVWAEEETAPALYPIRENGLWGYMNQAGEVVIKPQWAYVWPFDGETALVSTVDVSPYNYPICGDGVIDRDGQYVIAPQEHVTIEDYLTVYGVSYYDSITKESYEGFYDKVSGFYQPPIPEYNFVMLWGDDGIGPIAIENADGLTGYVDRTTGETVIPFIYTGESDDVCFYEGYACPADDITIVDANGVVMMRSAHKHLIDTAGNEIALPEGMIAVSPVINGCVVFIMAVPDMEENVTARDESSEDSTDEEEWYLSDGTKIEFPFYSLDRITGEKTEVDWHQYFDEDESVFGYGLARIDGSILYGPDPNISYMWEPDGEGMICFESWDDLCGHMDPGGNIIVTPRYHLPSGGERPRYIFSHGYAVFEDFGEKWPETSRWIILSAAGVEVFSQYRQPESGSTFRICGDVLENGLVWYETSDGYGLMRITDEGAEDLSDPVFERSLGCGLYEDDTECRFSEGLHPVKQNGLWGYINEQIQWVIPPQYNSADNFRDGLALVEKDGKLMYIDHRGAVVWEER